MFLRLGISGTRKFIELYRNSECLWNTSIESYKNKAARKVAIKNIVDQMGMPYLTPKMVTRKIKSIRTQYARELKLIEINNLDTSKLWWFNQADAFLSRTNINIHQEEDRVETNIHGGNKTSTTTTTTSHIPPAKNQNSIEFINCKSENDVSLDVPGLSGGSCVHNSQQFTTELEYESSFIINPETQDVNDNSQTTNSLNDSLDVPGPSSGVSCIDVKQEESESKNDLHSFISNPRKLLLNKEDIDKYSQTIKRQRRTETQRFDSTKSTGKKVAMTLQAKRNITDENVHFVNYFAAVISKFPPKRQIRIKMEILSCLDDFEHGNMHENVGLHNVTVKEEDIED